MKKKSSKRYKKLLESNKIKKIETLEDAIKKVKSNCTTKFNESIDISLTLNLKNKKDEAGLRTTVNLPNGNGKKVKVAVICEDGKNEEAKKLVQSKNIEYIENKCTKMEYQKYFLKMRQAFPVLQD